MTTPAIALDGAVGNTLDVVVGTLEYSDVTIVSPSFTLQNVTTGNYYNPITETWISTPTTIDADWYSPSSENTSASWLSQAIVGKLSTSEAYEIVASLTLNDGGTIEATTTTSFTWSVVPGQVISYNQASNLVAPAPIYGTTVSGNTVVLSIYSAYTGNYWNGSSWQSSPTEVGATCYQRGTTTGSPYPAETFWSYPFPTQDATGPTDNGILVEAFTVDSTNTKTYGLVQYFIPPAQNYGVVGITSPAYGYNFNGGALSISGMSNAETYGEPITDVSLQIQNTFGGTYWNGTAWVSDATSFSATPVAPGDFSTWTTNVTFPTYADLGNNAATYLITATANGVSVAETGVLFVGEGSGNVTVGLLHPIGNSSVDPYTGVIEILASASSGSIASVVLEIEILNSEGYTVAAAWNGTSWVAPGSSGTTLSATFVDGFVWEYTGFPVNEMTANNYSFSLTATDDSGDIGTNVAYYTSYVFPPALTPRHAFTLSFRSSEYVDAYTFNTNYDFPYVINTTGKRAFSDAFRSDGSTVFAYIFNTPISIPPSGGSVPPTGGFPVSIAGRNYMIDTSFEPYRREAFRHKSIAPQRQSLHFTNIPDDGTVSTEGLWRREARDWSLGSGQIYLDRKGSMDNRYAHSKGVNPWTQWQLTLHNDVKQQYTGSNNVKAIRVNNYIYIADGDTVKFATDWSGSYTTLSGTASVSPTLDWHTVKAANNSISGSGMSGASSVLTVDSTSGFQKSGAVSVNTTGGLLVFKYTGTTDTTFTGCTLLQGSTSWSISDGTEIDQANSLCGNYTFGGTVLDLTTDGYNVYVLTSTGVWQFAAGTSSPNQLFVVATNSDGNAQAWSGSINGTPFNGIIEYVGGRLMVGMSNMAVWKDPLTNTTGTSGGNIFDLSAAPHIPGTAFAAKPSGAAENLYVHPNPSWRWSGITYGSANIYYAGYTWDGTNADSGEVFRSTIPNNAATASTGVPLELSYPVHALPLTSGEYPTAIKGYLNYIFVGTNKGIRMCQPLNAYDPSGNAGDLKAGALLPDITEIPSGPVTAIVGNDRYIYWAWNNYDSVSTGLGRLDLTSFIDALSPAYASDLMIGTETHLAQGRITHLDWDPITNMPLISTHLTAGTGVGPYIAGNYIYTGDPMNTVKSGTIDSGIISYGIPDNKNAVSLDINVKNQIANPTNTSISTSISTDGGPPLDIGTYYGTTNKTTFKFQEQQFGEEYRVVTQLNSGESTESGAVIKISPTLSRWTLKALPGIPSGIMISAVILLYEPDEVDGTINYQDPYAEYAFLESLRQSQRVVEYIEGPFTAQVTVDQLDWLPERRRPITQGGYHGDIVVYLKTVTG